MELKAAPLPAGVTTPNDLGATVLVNCTEDEALAMEAWLRIAAGKDFDRDGGLFLKCAERIARSRGPHLITHVEAYDSSPSLLADCLDRSGTVPESARTARRKPQQLGRDRLARVV